MRLRTKHTKPRGLASGIFTQDIGQRLIAYRCSLTGYQKAETDWGSITGEPTINIWFTFNGFVQKGDWNYERWRGYETEGLLDYAFEFIEEAGDDPFLLFLSPHQPHYTPEKFAPDKFYDMLPDKISLPDNVPEALVAPSAEMYRHYLAMILAVDEMLGKLLDHLESRNLLSHTIFVFASDHGTQGGSQGVNPWSKKNPYEASIKIPAIISYPSKIAANTRSDALLGMVDFFPTICGLADIPIPATVEGEDLSGSLTNSG